ncbi:MAG: hypothetical protein K6E40_00390, partial [Desulfovibrio sp.]|nr:hypothetical protein [Desulfovibrio sp.]
NEKEKARGFGAFWVALGQPGNEPEKAIASAAYMEMELTPRLAGALVADALAGRIEEQGGILANLAAKGGVNLEDAQLDDWVPF